MAQIEAVSLDLRIHFPVVKPGKRVTNTRVKYKDTHWKGPVQVETPGNSFKKVHNIKSIVFTISLLRT